VPNDDIRRMINTVSSL